MTDLTPEKLAELRRLLSEAPPLPYRDSLGSYGAPSEGPTYVALEAQWEGRWEEVATGNYEKWCGMGIALAAAAVNALPALLDAAAERDALAAAVERVRALHWIDDDDDSGKWCGCCQSDFDAAQADEWWPCPTIRALDESEADK